MAATGGIPMCGPAVIMRGISAACMGGGEGRGYIGVLISIYTMNTKSLRVEKTYFITDVSQWYVSQWYYYGIDTKSEHSDSYL